MTSLRNPGVRVIRGRLAVIALLAAALLLATPGDSSAKKKNSRRQRGARAVNRGAELQEAKERLEFLQRQADSARAKLLRAEGRLRRLDPEAVKEADRYLKNVTEEILAAHDEASPLGQARRNFDTASRAYRLAREKAYQSAEYKAAYRRALMGRNRASAVARLRRETLESSREVKQARFAWKVAQGELSRLRNPILDASKQRKAAIEALRKVKKEQKKIAEHNASVRVHMLSATSMLSKAKAERKKLVAARRDYIRRRGK